MAVHGTVGEFSGIGEEWPTYIERLEFYFAANEVDSSDKRRAILLSCCGAQTYGLIRSLVAPAKPVVVSYKDIIEKVRLHYNPKPSQIVERYKFNSRSQKPGESIACYVAELRRLSEHCGYGDHLEEMLRDRLVCGIANGRCQQRLLAEADLTFDKAFKMVQAMELAERDAQELHSREQDVSAPIQKLQDQPKSRKKALNLRPCYRCGGQHDPTHCRFQQAECHACGKKGHIRKVCRSKVAGKSDTPQGPKTVHTTREVVPPSCDEMQEYSLYPVRGPAVSPLQTMVTIEGKVVPMEVDTGASVTVVSETTLSSIWGSQTVPPLQSTTVKLRTYTGSEIPVVGELTVRVRHQDQQLELPLVIVAGSGPSLLGRDWLSQMRLDWQSMFATQREETLADVIQRHEEVFQEGLGRMKGAQATLHINPEVEPKFYKPRPLPHALRSKVEDELNRLETNGVIVPVQHSDWATPIVPVLKPDGSVRICGDFKLTANVATKLETYPLPRIDDLFTSLAGGQHFSKLDLSHAYLQLPLAEESQPIVTVNTHKGLYRYQRLPFGVSSAPAVFQRTMETLLQGIPNVCVYLDDILVTGPSSATHLRNLEEVLTRLEDAGMRLKKEKCAFLMEEIEYLGHKISREGLQPTEGKIRAVAEAPVPTRVSELRSFLGLVNYYGKFLPDLATAAAPLYSLLRKTAQWCWGQAQQSAFEKVKTLLQSSDLLVHFDPQKEIILACDASPYGVGAVLSHCMEDGSERPIAYASRSLSIAERKYSHLDKEALAIVLV